MHNLRLCFRQNHIFSSEMIKKNSNQSSKQSVWARPGMMVIFRAELMPRRDTEKRTFRVKSVLPNNRVTLHDFEGEHSENEFEALKF